MKMVERLLKSALLRFGYDIHRANRSKCPRLPIPKPELIRLAIDAFADAFPLLAGSVPPEELEMRLGSYEWFYHFDFGGRQVGPNPGAPKEVRGHYQRYVHIFPAILAQTGATLAGQRILDVGCNAGFWSIQAARCGAASVVGIDPSETNIQQASFVAGLIGLRNVEYRVSNIYDASIATLGEFDISFFFGVLYHLDNPVLALRRLYELTRKFVVIDTQLANVDTAMLKMDDDAASRYHAQSYSNPLALIPSESAVLFMLRSVGFKKVFWVPHRTRNLPETYLNGRWGTFIAFK
jgi:SAM-dependent methyltransferase